MSFQNEGLEDDTVELLRECLIAALRVAADYVEVDDALLCRFAGVILDSWDAGYSEPDELITRALHELPITRH